MISNDTGPLHLAAAAGARVLGIYTCTSPKLTGPFGPRAATVQSCVWCAPTFLKNCNRLDCMTELSPDRVWSLVSAQIESALESKSVARDAVGLLHLGTSGVDRPEQQCVAPPIRRQSR